jgi:hypothetical protein
MYENSVEEVEETEVVAQGILLDCKNDIEIQFSLVIRGRYSES